MASPFTAGPRLSDPPHGDAKRQAVDSLRGYAFQLYAGALAWLALGEGEDLYLEVAEDYAIVAQEAMEAVQAKDTSGSGTATLRTSGVRQAIEALVDLTERNPGRRVHLRYLSTSQIGAERAEADRIEGIAGLRYWDQVSRGRAEVAPLRARLITLDLNKDVKDFLGTRSDDEVRDDLVRRITWDCGRGGIDVFKSEIEAVLTTDGLHGPAVDIDEIPRAKSILVEAVLDKAISPLPRRLTGNDRARVLRQATHTSLPTADLRRLLHALPLGGSESSGIAAGATPDWIYSALDVRDPHPAIDRDGLVDNIISATRAHGIAFVVGGTGFGKSLLARRAARRLGGTWLVADLRDLPAGVVRERLSLLLARSTRLEGGLILDDLDEWDDVGVERGLVQLGSSIARRGAHLVITTHREPTRRTLTTLGADDGALIPAVALMEDETGTLIEMADGERERWTSVVHFAGGGGHPQLTHAAILGLAARGWPREALVEHLLGQGSDILREKEVMRGRLRDAMPSEARSLLYRSSLVLGRLSRRIALALGEVAPVVDRPGEILDRLVGPWLDAVGPNEYRVSPLLGNAGYATLSDAEQTAVHKAVAETLMLQQKLSTDVVDALFFHALKGERSDGLFGLGTSIIAADDQIRREIAMQSVGFRHHRMDRPIYPEAPFISKILRLAQILLLVVRDDDDTLRGGIETLLDETRNGAMASNAEQTFEGMVLFKLLMERRICTVLHGQWFDLLLRFDDISSTQPLWQEAEKSAASASPTGLGVLGMLFTTQCTGIRSVAELEELFRRLEQLDAPRRDRLLSATASLPGGYLMLVSRAWMAEHEDGAINWLDAASRYLRMAQQANGWGNRALALRCFTARGVMFDEYGHDPDDAMSALDDAVLTLGPDPVLARARAKVLWRRRDHAAALPLLEEAVEASASEAPVERAFLLREAAISAAELGEWDKAATWFEQGRDGADEIGGLMVPMAIGLGTDAAVAAWHVDDIGTALTGMAGCLERLADVDPRGDIKSAYVHRIVRHAILWMHDSVSDLRIRLIDGTDAVMPPGAGSNPEPIEAVRDLPLAAIDVAWYLLAKVDLMTGERAGIAATVAHRLCEGPIPSQEITLRHRRVAAAITRSDPGALAENLSAWIAAMLYLEKNYSELLHDNLEFPVRGLIPDPAMTQLSTATAVKAIGEAALAFGILTAVAVRPLMADRLRTEISTRFGVQNPAWQTD